MRASERERLEPQIPFVRASSATAHDSTSSLPPSLPSSLPAAAAAAASLFHPPFSARPPAPVRHSLATSPWIPRCDCVSLGLPGSPLATSPSVLPLARRRSAESVPSRTSATSLPLSHPPSLCHSIAAESSQPDAGTARGRNDPRARQGRAEGVIRSSPYVHRAAPGIRIIKLRDSLPPPPPTRPLDHPVRLVIPRFSVG